MQYVNVVRKMQKTQQELRKQATQTVLANEPRKRPAQKESHTRLRESYAENSAAYVENEAPDSL